MRNWIIAAVIPAALAAVACGKVSMSNAGRAIEAKASGTLALAEDASGMVMQDDDDNSASEGPAVGALLQMAEDDPAAAEEVFDDFRCCLKHGQGHGLELCESGVELCVRTNEVANHPNAIVGRCR